jgi:hypothetical protein
MRWPCVEATLDILIPDMTVRIWIELHGEGSVFDSHDEEVVTMVKEWKRSGTETSVLVETLRKKFPELSAIQFIADLGGEYRPGVVYYVKDFTTDVHG